MIIEIIKPAIARPRPLHISCFVRLMPIALKTIETRVLNKSILGKNVKRDNTKPMIERRSLHIVYDYR